LVWYVLAAISPFTSAPYSNDGYTTSADITLIGLPVMAIHGATPPDACGPQYRRIILDAQQRSKITIGRAADDGSKKGREAQKENALFRCRVVSKGHAEVGIEKGEVRFSLPPLASALAITKRGVTDVVTTGWIDPVRLRVEINKREQTVEGSEVTMSQVEDISTKEADIAKPDEVTMEMEDTFVAVGAETDDEKSIGSGHTSDTAGSPFKAVLEKTTKEHTDVESKIEAADEMQSSAQPADCTCEDSEEPVTSSSAAESESAIQASTPITTDSPLQLSAAQAASDDKPLAQRKKTRRELIIEESLTLLRNHRELSARVRTRIHNMLGKHLKEARRLAQAGELDDSTPESSLDITLKNVRDSLKSANGNTEAALVQEEKFEQEDANNSVAKRKYLALVNEVPPSHPDNSLEASAATANGDVPPSLPTKYRKTSETTSQPVDATVVEQANLRRRNGSGFTATKAVLEVTRLGVMFATGCVFGGWQMLKYLAEMPDEN
ncbi:hypothetical protein KEM55_009344, partial [Ascosphaera atra]